jgi:hypothetical protein
VIDRRRRGLGEGSVGKGCRCGDDCHGASARDHPHRDGKSPPRQSRAPAAPRTRPHRTASLMPAGRRAAGRNLTAAGGGSTPSRRGLRASPHGGLRRARRRVASTGTSTDCRDAAALLPSCVKAVAGPLARRCSPRAISRGGRRPSKHARLRHEEGRGFESLHPLRTRALKCGLFFLHAPAGTSSSGDSAQVAIGLAA